VTLVTLVTTVSAFKTEKCSHHQLEQALSEFETCVDGGLSTNICTSFYQLDLCFPRHFSHCLSDEEVVEITQNAKANLRKALELIFEDHQLQYGGFSTGSLFDTCHDIPTHEEAVKADSRLIIWLEHASTDNDCSEEDKNLVNYGSYECLESERSTIENDLRTLFVRRTNVQDHICQVLSETVGECMKSDLPQCFSSRERLFIVKNMVKDFKEIFTAMEELLGLNYNVNISVCSIWSSALLTEDPEPSPLGSLESRSSSSSAANILSHSQGFLVSLLFVASIISSFR